MTIDIEDSLRAQATACHRDFACLEEDGPTCPVERYLGDGVLFVEPQKDIYCAYRTWFGYSSICGCPVCKELYLQYDK